ncbi:unnamed protein product [Callosobruchus maculatus]|uniref:Uncharacterized protein n=1 Tax=Callosobruchus maculatus TaxID=64391 RepID=A0A653D162_CALMS|nr:unnamed protein product [Callosobruchus maculatus]
MQRYNQYKRILCMKNDIEVSSISVETLLQSRLHVVKNCQTHLWWNTINFFPYFLFSIRAQS